MELHKLAGLIIRSSRQGDYNRILLIATANGRSDAICYNCLRPKSANHFLNEPFIYAEFQLKKGKGKLLEVASANLIKNFYNLRFSLEKVEVATEICQIIEKTIFPNESFPLPLVLNTLAILEQANEEKTKLILPLFTLRYLKEIGMEQETENELITHIQTSELSKLYNIKLSPETLSELFSYSKKCLESSLRA